MVAPVYDRDDCEAQRGKEGKRNGGKHFHNHEWRHVNDAAILGYVSPQRAPWERALIAAILEDAAHEYRKYKGARGPEGKERFRAAQRWIMGNRDDWIFAFNNVCELLGLNPDYVRRGLRGAKGKEGTTRHHHGARRRAA